MSTTTNTSTTTTVTTRNNNNNVHARAPLRKTLGALALALTLLSAQTHPALATGLVNNRFPECKADQNCVSTSSIRNPSKFMAPWTYLPQTSDPNVAWDALKQAIEEQPECTIVEMDDAKRYIHAEFPAFLPNKIDDVEFLLNEKEELVFFKSATGGDPVYLYPIIQPVGDLGKNQKRLEAIRQDLGWGEIGGI